jgi:hypothetical protein
MATPESDERSPARRAADEQIAAEPQKARLELSSDVQAMPVELALLHRGRDMELDTDKIDDAVLALLLLGASGNRAWKGFDWDALDRLHERSYISNPKTKAKSIVFTEEGLARGERLLGELFGRED